MDKKLALINACIDFLNKLSESEVETYINDGSIRITYSLPEELKNT